MGGDFRLAGCEYYEHGCIVVLTTSEPKIAGEGTREDNAEAIKWYSLSADQGNPIAQNNLGAMYYAGEGAELDKVQAYKWFYIAEKLGSGDGKENRIKSAKSMRSAEVLEAKRLARQWLSDFEEKK